LFLTSPIALPLTLVAAAFLFCVDEAHGQGPASEAGTTWPQFRGPAGSGVAGGAAPPTTFNPSTNVLWKTSLPIGHSSPAVWGDRIFITGFDPERKKLEVLGINRRTGAILWRRDVPSEQIETVHAVSSPATATPAVDAEQVYVYFGSYGVLAFDHDGQPRWAAQMPVVQVPFGSGTSPVVAGNLVLVNRQEPKDPFLVALNRQTGAVVWKQRHEIPAGLPIAFGSHSTPLIAEGHVVIHGPGETAAYDVRTGERKWWVTVTSSGTSTPTYADGMLYVATWYPFGEADQRGVLPGFELVLKQHDKDGDGTLAREEIPSDLLVFSRPEAPDVPSATMSMRGFFNRFNTNKDGGLDRSEWDAALALVQQLTFDHGLLAVKTGGNGDVTATHVRWKEKSAVPEVPSPLAYRSFVYLVRNGGILTCLDGVTGKVTYRGRVGAGGPYYASPEIAGDKLYLASGDGVITVLSTGPAPQVLARNDLGEPVFASPAFAHGVVYVRTSSALWAFGSRDAR
jgi:outer membrane protein assembly factor BamB